MTDFTRRAGLAALGGLLLGACASRETPAPAPDAGFEPARFQAWTDSAPVYRLFPGDEVEVTVHTATELPGPATIGPDGRIVLPLAGSVMVTDLSATQAARAIADRYARVLRDPIVEVRPLTFGAQQVLVGGEVRTPGIYDMPSPRVGALEAIALAGGSTNRGRLREVVVLRRSPEGGVMMRTVNVRAARAGQSTDSIPLLRHDIVYVPASTVAEINDFVELYVRNIIPLDNAFAFAIADRVFNNP